MRMLYVPVGFAHGFCVLSDEADVAYRCSSYYDPGLERSVALDDPDLGISWPAGPLAMSARDRAAPRLRDVADGLSFEYRAPA
jgi:dTDP-4-dehydrorhamnose 3,5-epimerase